jgi:hypothetical protein
VALASSLLVVYDGTPSGDESIRLACALAASDGYPIEVLSIVLVPRSLPLRGLPVSFDERNTAQLARACDLARERGIDIRTRVVHAYETWQGVLRECERLRPAALFLALDWSPTRWLPERLPMAVRHPVRNAPCPVYLAHAPGPSAPSSREAIAEAERVLLHHAP